MTTSSGVQVAGFNSSGNLTLGSTTTAGLPGTINLSDLNAYGATGTVTLSAGVAPGTSGTNSYSYGLALPTSAPSSALLCLESGTPGTTTQLQFTSCANNSPTVSFVSTVSSSTTTTSGTVTSVTPSSVGDLLILTTSIPTSTTKVNSISGTNGTNGTWRLAKVSPTAGSSQRVEEWYSIATSNTAGTVTVTYNATTGSTAELDVSDFTAIGVGSGTSWGLSSSGSVSNSSNSSALNFSGLVPTSNGQLYFGYGNDQNVGLGTGGTCGGTVTSGSTTWQCNVTNGTGSVTNNIIDYDLNAVSASGTYTGAVNLGSSSVNTNSVSSLFTAYISSTAINNSVSTQQGNFNIQSANAGNVTGTLQANVAGTADILDIRWCSY